MNTTTTVAPSSSSAPLADELKEIAIWSDGSGKAWEYLTNNLESISKRERACKTLREFIEKHKETLAGICWRVWGWGEEPEVELTHGSYRGKLLDAKGVARLWGGTGWVRYQEEWDKTRIHWRTEIDGVTLIIKEAERLEIPRMPKAGGRVHL